MEERDKDMYDKVVFYCHFGNGDLFESREFVKDMMNIIPAKHYYYAHGKNKRMFIDFPNMGFTEITEDMNGMKDCSIKDNNLYLNTWIGRDSKYVLHRVGCVIDKSFEMFNDILDKYKLGKLTKGLLEYIPNPNYGYFQTNSIDKYLRETIGRNKILVCNGWVGSMQAQNFDFTPAIESVAANHSGMDFLVTQKFETQLSNIKFTSDLIKTNDGFDLNEISYLAKFVDVIIGRKSGPFVFAHTRDVWYDGDKKSLSFTYEKTSSHFLLQSDLPLHKFWSPATTTETVIDAMENVIKKG